MEQFASSQFVHHCGQNCRYCQMANWLLPDHESDDEDHVGLGEASVQSDTNIAASQESGPPTLSESQGNITMAIKRHRTRHNTLAVLPKVFVLPQQEPEKLRPQAKPITAEQISEIRKQIESKAVCLPGHIRKACCWNVVSPPRSISVLVELCESFALHGYSIKIGVTADPHWRYYFCSGHNDMESYYERGYICMHVVDCNVGEMMAQAETDLIAAAKAHPSVKRSVQNVKDGGDGPINMYSATFLYICVRPY